MYRAGRMDSLNLCITGSYVYIESFRGWDLLF